MHCYAQAFFLVILDGPLGQVTLFDRFVQMRSREKDISLQRQKLHHF